MMATNKEADLQARYTQLLEQRIAHLEGLLRSSAKADSRPDEQTSKKNEDSQSDDSSTDTEAEQAPKVEIVKTRYRNVIRKWDQKLGAHKDEDVIAVSPEKSYSGDVAYTFRRVYGRDNKEERAYSELTIEDTSLISVLKSVIGSKYPGINFEGTFLTISAPFAPIVHNWQKLQEKAKTLADCQAKLDLEHLLARIESAPELEKYFKTRENNIAAQITTYETLWTSFGPGTRVVAKPFMNTPQIFEILTSPIPYVHPPPRLLRMSVWCWDWNGRKMVRVHYRLGFYKFRGTKLIKDLECFPIEFHPEMEETLASIKMRSEKYISSILTSPGSTQMFMYSGDAYCDRSKGLVTGNDDKKDGDDLSFSPHWTDAGVELNTDGAGSLGMDTFNPAVVPIKGEFMCDAAVFLQYGTGSHVLGNWLGDFVDEDPREADGLPIRLNITKALEDDAYQLLPPRLLGYAMREKMWAQFAVDYTKEAPLANPKKFRDDLQLDPKYKDMIEALVYSHQSLNAPRGDQQKVVTDVVQGKGQGLVLLLHGPPGVGKTLTAETIAEATGKPLFIVSVAEIGLEPSKAESNLEKLFRLASKWEAILLLDEADVFLETRRSASTAGRNALVSVLLRVLEYYQGIIILTTNRIKSIDVAVISRIHLAIRYTSLTEQQMIKIFTFFLNQLEPDLIDNRDEINTFVNEYAFHYELNGRQIRNVVSGALASARHNALKTRGLGRLTPRHLKDACEMTRQFEQQLKENSMIQRHNNEVITSS